MNPRQFTSVAHVLADVLRAPIDFDKLPAATPRFLGTPGERDLARNLKNRTAPAG